MTDKSIFLHESLIDELLCIADTKWVLGHWYIKVMQNGRGLTDFNALSAMSQDVLGHTRALFSFMEQATPGAADQLEFNRQRDQIHSMAMLDSPPQNWADLIISAMVAELALQKLFDYAQNKSPGLAALSAKSREECEFHALYFHGILQGLNDEEQGEAQASLNTRLPIALDWFSMGAKDIVHELGYRSHRLDEIRASFIDECRMRVNQVLPKASIDGLLAGPCATPWDAARRRPEASALPPKLWEFMLPTNEQAVFCRRPLNVSSEDSIRFTAV